MLACGLFWFLTTCGKKTRRTRSVCREVASVENWSSLIERQRIRLISPRRHDTPTEAAPRENTLLPIAAHDWAAAAATNDRDGAPCHSSSDLLTSGGGERGQGPPGHVRRCTVLWQTPGSGLVASFELGRRCVHPACQALGGGAGRTHAASHARQVWSPDGIQPYLLAGGT